MKFSHKFAAIAAALSPALVFAEGEAGAGGNTLDASLVTSYITSGQTAVVAILTAGAVIVGSLYIWGLLKKALRAAK